MFSFFSFDSLTIRFSSAISESILINLFKIIFKIATNLLNFYVHDTIHDTIIGKQVFAI